MTTSSAVFVTPLSPAQSPTMPSPLRRASGLIGDLLALAGIVAGIPVVILAVGIPIALVVRFLSCLGGLF